MFESGAPVIPTAVIGSARVREWRRGHFPRITVRYGEPIRVDRDPAASLTRQQALAEEVMRAVRALYDAA
jgi:1-acyl-sn-glycerol-3-phosphate acyltransferase